MSSLKVSPAKSHNRYRWNSQIKHWATYQLIVIIAMLMVIGLSSLDAAEPSNSEQLMLEFTNRFRMNPQAELDLLVNINHAPTATWQDPRSDNPDIANALSFFNVNANALDDQWSALEAAPPLAWNSFLNDSATTFSQVMLANNEQSHDLAPHFLDLGARIQSEGYSFTGGGTGGENLFAFTKSIIHAHAAFIIDWGEDGVGSNDGIQDPAGHRDILINTAIREIGVGMIAGNGPSGPKPVGPFLITQHLAVALASDAFLTGVAYDDTDHNNFYTGGEGLSGLMVKATRIGDNQMFQTTTWGSGGYTLELAPGNYNIVASGANLDSPITYLNVSIGNDNVKIDFIPDPDPVPGDVNGDFQVDNQDLSDLLEHYAKASGALLSEGDLDGDGKVGLADLLILKKNFGTGSVSASGAANPTPTAVPEPTTFTLILGLAFCAILCQLPRFLRKRNR